MDYEGVVEFFQYYVKQLVVAILLALAGMAATLAFVTRQLADRVPVPSSCYNGAEICVPECQRGAEICEAECKREAENYKRLQEMLTCGQGCLQEDKKSEVASEKTPGMKIYRSGKKKSEKFLPPCDSRSKGEVKPNPSMPRSCVKTVDPKQKPKHSDPSKGSTRLNLDNVLKIPCGDRPNQTKKTIQLNDGKKSRNLLIGKGPCNDELGITKSPSQNSLKRDESCCSSCCVEKYRKPL